MVRLQSKFFLSVLFALSATLLLMCLWQPTKAAALPLTLAQYATGLTSPVDIAHSGISGDTRLFVVEREGYIKTIDDSGNITGNFLDINARVQGGGEEGLLGLAFHPDYATNRFFFVYYVNNSGNITISRFTRDAGNANLADANSERMVLTIPHPTNSNHNGGDLNFNPANGYLYAATGDGGSGNDPPNNAQNLNVLLGKVLRLDINNDAFLADNNRNYAIPPDNPFVDAAGSDEIWAYGLRNPWRFSFDKSNNDLFIGDVGQGTREEINFQPSASSGGENYGWRCREGSIPNPSNPSGCAGFSGYTNPIGEYSLSGAPCAVTGGYMYRGNLYPGLVGYYLFADYCSGDMYTLKFNGSSWNQVLQTQFSGRNISSFGQDYNGELYVSDITNGLIYKVQSVDTAPPTVSVSAPANNANVSGNVAISANAADNSDVTKVEFYIDGTLHTTDTDSPYQDLWDSTSASGSHSIEAKAYDANNNVASSTVSVVVSPAPLTAVYRLKRGDSYLYTASALELANAVNKYGFVFEGTAFYASRSAAGDLAPVYRLNRAGQYLFTTSALERNRAVDNYGFKLEGIGFYAYTGSAANLTPAYRLSSGDSYLLTISTNERDQAVANSGYTSEGIGFYVSKAASSHISPTYRLKRDGKYLYTLSTTEVASAINRHGFVFENIAFNASNSPTPSLAPVYRLNRGTDYFYTISSAERDNAVANFDYTAEGTAFYASAASNTGLTTAVYRLRGSSYLYTTSTIERDQATAHYGFTSEGVGFYTYAN